MHFLHPGDPKSLVQILTSFPHGEKNEVIFFEIVLKIETCPGVSQTCFMACLRGLQSWGGNHKNMRWPPLPIPEPLSVSSRQRRDAGMGRWLGRGWTHEWPGLGSG